MIFNVCISDEPLTWYYTNSAVATNTMSSLTEEECNEQVSAQAAAFVTAAIVIFVWCMFVTALYCCCLKASLDAAPALGAQFFCVTGILQLVAVVATVVVFIPLQCPADCCPGGIMSPSIYYGIAATEGLIGLFWLCVARKRSLLAQQLSREHGSGQNAGIFTKIPGQEDASTELELTETTDDSGDVL